MSPEPGDVGIYRRLSELMLWILHKERRPGLLGRAARISGVVKDGTPAELVREGDAWTFEKQGGDPEELADEGAVLNLIPREHFEPLHVTVVPDIAPLLFHGAVEAAEASMQDCNEALSIAIKANPDVKEFMSPELVAHALTFPLPNFVDFALGNAALDKAVRHSIASIALAIATIDAQLNTWANDKGGFSRSDQREPLISKFALVATKFGGGIDTQGDPFATLHKFIQARNLLIHAKGREQRLPIGPARAGRDLSVQARGTCHAVRRALVHLASAIGKPKPPYLAYCPPGDPEDDEAWRGAVVGRGSRDDPDYPPLGASG